jgi:polyisoprenoid-binding protein YceI
MKKSELISIIAEQYRKISVQAETTKVPADVANLSKAQSSASTVLSKAKTINTPQEFSGAFENWFQTLGFEPGKLTKGTVRTLVDQVLTKLGYK